MISVIDNDIEFNGHLSRTLEQGHGSEFNLMLSMLMEDWWHRPRIEPDAKHDQSEANSFELPVPPEVPLKAATEHWERQEYAGQLVRQQQLMSARLWSSMHPCPLSLHNDARHIDDEVMANMSFAAQQRVKGDKPPASVTQDATGLYEILKGMEPEATRQAA